MVASPAGMSALSARTLLASARRRSIVLPGADLEIALLDWGGSGPLALLLHANGFCKGVWGLVAEALRRDFRVVALDARGHGDSSKPSNPDAYVWTRFAEDARSVATALAAEQPGGRVAVGIGNSFGGTALLGAAADHPELFGRLLLVDPVVPAPPSVPPTAERVAHFDRLVGGARRRRGRFTSRAEACAHWAARRLFAAWDRRALELYALDGLGDTDDGMLELKCPPEIEAAVFERTGTVDVFAVAPRVTTPTRFLWAARGTFPRFVYETIAASMSRARVDTVDAGHLMPMERPDLVVSHVFDSTDDMADSRTQP